MNHLPRLLFWFNLSLAFALLALVLLCPLTHNGTDQANGLARLLALFAHDGTLRRTALASAAGLAVTAFLFFRTSAPNPAPAASKPERKSSRTPPIAGA
jgi:hypothetical protein